VNDRSRGGFVFPERHLIYYDVQSEENFRYRRQVAGAGASWSNPVNVGFNGLLCRRTK
jgi:hypothetical protein